MIICRCKDEEEGFGGSGGSGGSRALGACVFCGEGEGGSDIEGVEIDEEMDGGEGEVAIIWVRGGAGGGGTGERA